MKFVDVRRAVSCTICNFDRESFASCNPLSDRQSPISFTAGWQSFDSNLSIDHHHNLFDVREVASTMNDIYMAASRKVIQAEILALESQLFDKKRQLNELVRIACLPNEILCMIFLAHHPGKGGNEYLRWIKATTWVCHRWRAAALNEPRLWTHLDSTSGLSWLQRALVRSKNAPLHVKLDVMHFPDADSTSDESSDSDSDSGDDSESSDGSGSSANNESKNNSDSGDNDDVDNIFVSVAEPAKRSYSEIITSSILKTEAARVLDLSLSIDTHSAAPGWPKLEQLTKPFPILQRLTLTSPRPVGQALPNDFLGRHAPCLSKVTLARFVPSWDSPILHGLTTLIVTQARNSHPIDLHQALQCLRHTNRLHRLELNGAFREGNILSSSSQFPIQLPHLRILILSEDPRLNVHFDTFVNNLRVSPRCSIDISINGPSDEVYLADLGKALRSCWLLDSEAGLGSPHSPVKVISIGGPPHQGCEFTLKGKGEGQNWNKNKGWNGSIRVAWDICSYSDCTVPPSLVQAFASTFPMEDIEDVTSSASGSWQEIFLSPAVLPGVVHWDARHGARKFIGLLERDAAFRTMSDTGCLLPALRKLSLHRIRFAFDPKPMAELEQFIKLRAKNGHPLESIRLVGCSGTNGAMVKRLRKLVTVEMK